MANEDDPVEYLRQLGKTFAEWRRYQLLSQRDLVRKTKSDQGFGFSESILSKFETGMLAAYVQAAADLMGIDPKELLHSPPDLDTLVRDHYQSLPKETQPSEIRKELMEDLPTPKEDKPVIKPGRPVEEEVIDAEAWVKYDKTHPDSVLGVMEKIDQFSDKAGLSVLQHDYLVGMLIGAARAETHRDRHKGQGFDCCREPDPYVVDKYVRNGIPHEIVRCNNCEAEWEL